MNKCNAILKLFLLAILFHQLDAAHNHDIDVDSDIGFTATVYLDDEPKCTAALISRMWALTTCLCVKDIPNSRVYVRIADPTITKGDKHTFYKNDRIEKHPECFTSDSTYHAENDIALIQLAEPFFDSRSVFMTKLPYHLTYWTPDSALALDISSYTDLNNKARTLKEAVWHTSSFLLHPDICHTNLRDKNYKIGMSMCASYFHKDGDDCSLDIGAPLTYDYILIGLLTYKEEGCGKDNAVAAFVNIPMHSQWIRKTIKKYTAWITL